MLRPQHLVAQRVLRMVGLRQVVLGVNDGGGVDPAESDVSSGMWRWLGPTLSSGAVLLSLLAVLVSAAALLFSIVGGFDKSTPGLASPSLFDAPEDLEALIKRVRASTVVVSCGEFQGSGWVVDFGGPEAGAGPDELALDKRFPTEVVTNNHVIEDCQGEPRSVTATAGDTTFDAVLYSFDEDNDLALLGIKQQIAPLQVSGKPEPGWWAMVVGAPYGFEGSVAIGNVMNTDGKDVVTSAPLNGGNSGGPLVNSRGEVMGTNTWTLSGQDDPQDWNVAVGVPTLCIALVDCDETFRW